MLFRLVPLLRQPEAVNDTIRAYWYGDERAPTPPAPGAADPAE